MGGLFVTHDAETRYVGFWGEKTATLDWCEENYHHSSFVAEFCFLGGWQCYKAGSFLPERYAILFLWMSVVGIGSFLFHATLKYYMQLLDEVPMLFFNSQMLYIIWHPDIQLKMVKRIPTWIRSSPTPYYLFSLIILCIYIKYPSCTVFFQISFGATLLLIVSSLRAYSLQLLSEGGKRMDTVDRLLKRSAVFGISAFIIWNIDNVFCHHLRLMRNDILPSIFGPLLQLHAWWHILITIGGVHAMVAVVMAWCKTRKVKNWVLKAHCGGILPWIHFEEQKANKKSK